MDSFLGLVFYALVFLSVYAQLFFLITFFENRKRILIRDGSIKLENYPMVSIAVPAWNEGRTIEKTMHSLLALNYPKDKLKIFLIDDGSSDNTFEVMKQFENEPNVIVLQKENGGKHTALNLALEKSPAPFFGCLDADAFAEKESLIRIMSYFEKVPSAMAVAPSIIVNEPKNILQKAQGAEYEMAVYVKKMLGFLGAIHVTPGPLTVFRREVFDNLGPYKHAHNTEDMEIAYRMQVNGYKIEQCNDAFVYTNTPNTVKKLFKQRLRWIYGFINNTLDYKNAVFRKKYGNFALFTVPVGIISIVTASFLFIKFLINFVKFIIKKIEYYSISGFEFSTQTSSFDPFFINTRSLLFLTIFLYMLVFTSMILGRKMANKKIPFSVNMVYFFLIYSVVAPFWLLKAIWNTIVAKKPAWR